MRACYPEEILHEIQGDLEGAPRRRLLEHLLQCPICREEKASTEEFFFRVRQESEKTKLSRSVARIAKNLSQQVQFQKQNKWLSVGLSTIAALLLAMFGLRIWMPLRVDINEDLALLQLRKIQDNNGSWAGSVGPTAMATLALLENGGAQESSADQNRVRNAIHFLTRESKADPIDEILRCLVLLREREHLSSSPTPQLQMAFDHAIRKASSLRDPRVASLLADLVQKARNASLQTDSGERLLGRWTAEFGASSLQSNPWASIATYFQERNHIAMASEPVRLALSSLGHF